MQKILVLNAGSSSYKSCLYEIDALPSDRARESAPPLWRAEIDWQQCPSTISVTANGIRIEITLEQTGNTSEGRKKAIAKMLNTLYQGDTAVVSDLSQIEAVGHRVVHGGRLYRQSIWIDSEVKSGIADLSPLAPNHNPANLEGIQIAEQLLTGVPQFAVFDTAFHSHLTEAIALYPVPQSWRDLGIRRYGFHGISHQYCAQRSPQLLNRPLNSLRLVTCHLGNGASLCAIRNGQSIDTTMGFTPLDGLMMGSRSGSLDPGILTYLMREQGYDHKQLDYSLNQESGLKGVSGLSSDMREIEIAMADGHPKAKLAFDMYIHRLVAEIAKMTASLGGLDALVFTAGVGENSSLVRAESCKRLAFLGITLSEKMNGSKSKENQKVDRILSTKNSTAAVLVIHTQENWQITQEYPQLLPRPKPYSETFEA